MRSTSLCIGARPGSGSALSTAGMSPGCPHAGAGGGGGRWLTKNGVPAGGVAAEGEDVRVVGGDDAERVLGRGEACGQPDGTVQLHRLVQRLLRLALVVPVVDAAACARPSSAQLPCAPTALPGSPRGTPSSLFMPTFRIPHPISSPFHLPFVTPPILLSPFTPPLAFLSPFLHLPLVPPHPPFCTPIALPFTPCTPIALFISLFPALHPPHPPHSPLDPLLCLPPSPLPPHLQPAGKSPAGFSGAS